MRPFAPFLGLALVACSLDVTEPTLVRPVNATDLDVVFCFDDQPNWFAIRNEGQPWYVVSRIAQQRYPLAVSPKVAIAFGRSFLGSFVSSDITVLYVTAAELAQARCAPLIGSNILYANVAGTGLSDRVFAAISSGFGGTDPSFRTGTPTQVRIDGVAPGPGDMLAYLLAQSGGRPKYILRHAVDAPHLSLLAPLDFSSADAMFTDRFPITVDGGVAADVFATFLSGFGTVRELGRTPVLSGSGTYIGLPQTVLAPGDLHRQTVAALDGRQASVYTAALGPLNVALGPMLATPTLTTTSVDTATVLRMRATLAEQTEYPTFASATFYQGTFLNRSITVVVSAGYRGGAPGPWEIEVPVLPFLVADAQLQPGAETHWQVEGWSTTTGLFFGHGGAADGSVVRCAMATSLNSLKERGCRSPLFNFPRGAPPEDDALLSP